MGPTHSSVDVLDNDILIRPTTSPRFLRQGPEVCGSTVAHDVQPKIGTAEGFSYHTDPSQSREISIEPSLTCVSLSARVVSHRTCFLFLRTLKFQGHAVAWDDGAVNALPTLCLCALSTSAACLLSSSFRWRPRKVRVHSSTQCHYSTEGAMCRERKLAGPQFRQGRLLRRGAEPVQIRLPLPPR